MSNFQFSNFQISNLSNFIFFKFQISKFESFKISFFSKSHISNLRFFELRGSASILEYQKNIKLRRKRSHMKDTGKSSSRKLRRVVYYLLYRMDPQKTHYKISFSTKISKIQNSGFFFLIPPSKGPFKGPLKGPRCGKVLRLQLTRLPATSLKLADTLLR